MLDHWEVCFVEESADAYYYNVTTGNQFGSLTLMECKLAAARAAMSQLDQEVDYEGNPDQAAAYATSAGQQSNPISGN